MAIYDLASRIRNSVLFHPLLYFMFGATLYYTWCLTSQNTQILEKLNIVNFALSETNKDVVKATTKLKLCLSKENSFSNSNKDLQTKLSNCETQSGEINENLNTEKKAKDKFLVDFETLLNSLMSDSNNILKMDSLDSVLKNIEIFKNQYNEQTESKKKEMIKLQEDMKAATGRLEDQLKTYITQNEILQKKLKESSAVISSLNNQVDGLNNQIDELKFEKTKVLQERNLKVKKEDKNDNVRMINLNEKKDIETLPNVIINQNKNIKKVIRAEEKLSTTLATGKISASTTIQPQNKENKKDEEEEENDNAVQTDIKTTPSQLEEVDSQSNHNEAANLKEGIEKSTDEDSVNKNNEATQDEDGTNENNENSDKLPSIDKSQNNETDEVEDNV